MGTDTTRNETWNDNVSHMLAKTQVVARGGSEFGEGNETERVTTQGRTARGDTRAVLSRPALSNYQMDLASEIAGYYLLAACEMTLLVSVLG